MGSFYCLQPIGKQKDEKIYTVTHSKTIKVVSKNLKRQVHA